MGREDVKRALLAMEDDQVRESLSEGDFEAVGGLDLTEEERTLVRDAAGDYPEVAGFEGQRVSFDVVQGDKGLQAANVTALFSLGGDRWQQAARYAIGGTYRR